MGCCFGHKKKLFLWYTVSKGHALEDMLGSVEVYQNSVIFVSHDFERKNKLMEGKSSLMLHHSMSHFGHYSYWYVYFNVYFHILQFYYPLY